MFSIESNIKSDIGYSFNYPHNNYLCFVIYISSSLSKKELERYNDLVQNLARLTSLVVIIDPKIKYEIVSSFQHKNAHILRLNLDNIYTKSNSPFYLLNKEEKLLSVISNKDSSSDVKKVNLDLYIPNLIKEYDLSKYELNYDIFLDTALITLKDQKHEKYIKDFFTKVLKVNKIIFLYSQRKFFARFLKKNYVVINEEKDNTNYDENLKKLSIFKQLIVNTKENLLSNYILLNNYILIDTTFYNKYKVVLNDMGKLFNKSIQLIDFKSVIKNFDLLDVLVPIPYSSKHVYFEEEREVEKKFKTRREK